MKFSIGLLALLIISCSTPRYTYYFNEPTAGVSAVPVLPVKGEALTGQHQPGPDHSFPRASARCAAVENPC
jgi:hypothetical protein